MLNLTETITWKPVSESMPDDDTTVLVKTPSPGEPVWLGYHDGIEWQSVEGGSFAYAVTHWAEMPEGPKES